MNELARWVEDRLNEDTSISDEAGVLVLAALEGRETLDAYLADGASGAERDERTEGSPVSTAEEPSGAFLSGLSVQGFRGIGSKVDVSLHPQPGLTIIAGRNGSGKSSLAEALEVALTGTTYRWKRRTAQWKEHWRNLHSPAPAGVEVRVAEEGRGQSTVGLSWDDGTEEVDHFRTWVQRAGQKREPGLTSLGWHRALNTYRPMMSYDELDGLLEGGPSGLYDALSAALGVEELGLGIKVLESRAKTSRAPGADLGKHRKVLQTESKAVNDERADATAKLLQKTSPDTTALRTLATGVVVQDTGPLAWLRTVAELTAPAAQDVEAAATALNAALDRMVDEGAEVLARRRRRVQMRADALHLHEEYGDMTCPVCNTGELDAPWAQSSRELIARERTRFAGLDRAAEDLDRARRSARGLVGNRPASLNAAPLENLSSLTVTAREAWDSWAAAPASDVDLVAHLRERHAALDTLLAELRAAAATEYQARQDQWTPWPPGWRHSRTTGTGGWSRSRSPTSSTRR